MQRGLRARAYFLAVGSIIEETGKAHCGGIARSPAILVSLLTGLYIGSPLKMPNVCGMDDELRAILPALGGIHNV